MPVHGREGDAETGSLDSPGEGYRFEFGPFRFVSELHIPELRAVRGTGRIAVAIEVGETPRALAGAGEFGELCWVGRDEYLLHIPGVAWFYVSGGRRVRVELYEGAPRADVSSYLLGSVFGALCHQNGLLPLHASSIEKHGAVTAFLGESGAGKSTLAAALQARGHRIVSDDICLLEDEGGSVRVVPVAGWLKLWRQSLDHLRETPDERNRVFQQEDKFRVYLEQDAVRTLKLARLVFLERAEVAVPRIEALSTTETMARMMEMSYLAYVPELNGTQGELFGRCARALAAGAMGYRLMVPWGLERLDDVVRVVEGILVE